MLAMFPRRKRVGLLPETTPEATGFGLGLVEIRRLIVAAVVPGPAVGDQAKVQLFPVGQRDQGEKPAIPILPAGGNGDLFAKAELAGGAFSGLAEGLSVFGSVDAIEADADGREGGGLAGGGGAAEHGDRIAVLDAHDLAREGLLVEGLGSGEVGAEVEGEESQ